jgi:hypothetical protein
LKAVRQHQRFGPAFRCVGEETKRAAAVTALALRARCVLFLPSSVDCTVSSFQRHKEINDNDI